MKRSYFSFLWIAPFLILFYLKDWKEVLLYLSATACLCIMAVVSVGVIGYILISYYFQFKAKDRIFFKNHKKSKEKFNG